VSTRIGQRELRNDNAQIIARVVAGESFVVTRNGVPVADVVPHEVSGTAQLRPASDIVRAWADADARAVARRRALDAQGWVSDIRTLNDDELDADDAWTSGG
jgi:prevent-host-death family protein